MDIYQARLHQELPHSLLFPRPELQTVAEDIAFGDGPEAGVAGFPVMLGAMGTDGEQAAGAQNARHLQYCTFGVGKHPECHPGDDQFEARSLKR